MTTMYGLSPVINQDMEIDLPTCMYEMKNIHGDGDTKQKLRIVSMVTGQFITSIKTPLAEVAALEARQEKILTQLAELKEQVLNLCDVLKENNTETETKHVTKVIEKKNRAPVNEELVLNVHPNKPCWSILALGKLWNDVDFRLSTYIHSSVRSKVPQEFKTNRTSDKASSSVINLTFIWKEVLDTQLLVSGIHGNIVMGETNLLRYLVRLLDNQSYEDVTDLTETMKIDQILDLSHQLTHQETPKDKQVNLTTLAKILGTSQWFFEQKKPGICDLAAWSSLKQSSPMKLPTNLITWFEKCEKIFSH